MRFHRYSVLTIPALALSAGLLACGTGRAASTAVRSDSAGVEIVSNPGPDRTLALPVTPSDTIIDPAVDTALQGEARGVQVGADAAGRLVFVDGGFADRRVLRQEQDGTIHQVGRRGGGPGEYQMVGGVGVSPDGELLVVDYSKQGFVRFDGNDRPLPLIPWSLFGRGFSRAGGYYGGGLVVQRYDMPGGGREAPVPGPDARPVQVLHFAGPVDTLRVAEVTEPPMKMMMFEQCHVGFAQPPLFFPSLQWTGNAELLAVVHDGSYRIDVWKGGRWVRSIRRDLPPRVATDALALQELGEGQRISVGGGPPCLIPAADILEKQGRAESVPAIRRLSMAADGTLWVERYTVKGETPLRDIFDPSGAYLGTLAGDIPWPQAWLPDGRYVSVGADADSLPVVVRYAVGGGVRAE
ncbi:MAG TPA: hypothetical protein VG940_01025 [Gemmatimonadales bacterium]|nr:hypothetical protein [Gemmatimonadales bacterium]